MTPHPSPRVERWQRYLADLEERLSMPVELAGSGKLARVAGLVLEATGIRAPVGAVCDVTSAAGPVLAEVVGFHGDRAYLMPSGDVQGLASGAAVTPARLEHPRPTLGVGTHPWRRTEDRCLHLPVGDGLLGRVVDAHGEPMDRAGPLVDVHRVPMQRRSTNAMDREPIRTPLDTGVRAINAMLTVGRGQRIGLFAGTGVGKSVLLGMMARYTAADVIVVGLIGERGREVKEFIEDILGWDGPPGSLRAPPAREHRGAPHEPPGGEPGRARSVVVAAPADVPPIARMQAALYATTIAEHFRDQGKSVLLLMDSLTRYAMAQREIALAIGEPPATKGYPPSVFARLPQLVERSGMGRAGQGSITAFYTVLSEGDDLQDPIADAARGILDGHIVLSRELAEAGHFPAIDVERSISRVMTSVTPREHQDSARRARAMLSRYGKARDLIALGAYKPGHDAELDAAVRAQPALAAMLQQGMHERAPLDASVARLVECTRGAA